MSIIIGDLIPEGKYQSIHSRFKSVINFNYKDFYVVSIVENKIGCGPYNIVLNEALEIKDINCFSLNKDTVFVGDIAFTIINTQIYKSELPKVSGKSIQYGLDVILGIIKKLPPSKSMLFLLDNAVKFEAMSIFDHKIKEVFVENTNVIFKENNFTEGVSKLKGLGYGLTPSGDDFIAGILMALNFTANTNKNLHIALKNSIFDIAKGANKISNTGFLAAKDGRCNEKFFNLLDSLSTKNDSIIHKNFINFLKIGETSGADFFAGFFLTIKKYLC